MFASHTFVITQPRIIAVGPKVTGKAVDSRRYRQRCRCKYPDWTASHTCLPRGVPGRGIAIKIHVQFDTGRSLPAYAYVCQSSWRRLLCLRISVNRGLGDLASMH
jgi:hypothetical protein